MRTNKPMKRKKKHLITGDIPQRESGTVGAGWQEGCVEKDLLIWAAEGMGNRAEPLVSVT